MENIVSIFHIMEAVLPKILFVRIIKHDRMVKIKCFRMAHAL